MAYKRFGKSKGFRATGKFKKRFASAVKAVTAVPRPLSMLPCKRSFTFLVEERFAIPVENRWYYFPRDLSFHGLSLFDFSGQNYTRLPPGMAAFLRLFSHVRLDSAKVDSTFTVVPPTNFKVLLEDGYASRVPGGPVVMYDGIVPSTMLGVNNLDSSSLSTDGAFRGLVASMKSTTLTSQGSQNQGYRTSHFVDFRKWHNLVTLPPYYSAVASLPSTSEASLTNPMPVLTLSSNLLESTDLPRYAVVFDLQGYGANVVSESGQPAAVYVISRTRVTWNVTFSGQQRNYTETVTVAVADGIAN